MTPLHEDTWLQVWQGDCREVLAATEPESVHCVVTSPPYWGLRDYGTATWIGGDAGCDHKAPPSGGRGSSAMNSGQSHERWIAKLDGTLNYRDTCGKCGAVREDAQLGLEPTPEAYVENMVAVFRSVWRVLRKDGTLWLNLGDSYANPPPSGTAGQWNADRNGEGHAKEAIIGQRLIGGTMAASGLAAKNLVGIPWRVAFALQADGWYLRSDIIWAKPNPMPESVTDRPTKSHEYIFMLSKSPRYFWDADAVREPAYRADTSPQSAGRGKRGNGAGAYELPSRIREDFDGARNLRSVWNIATAPYPGAHFATFPPKLVEPCIKAGTSGKGVCSECGAPWEREVERTTTGIDERRMSRAEPTGVMPNRMRAGDPSTMTTGWHPTCAHDAPTVPAVVLDPFAGSGTTGMVAQRLSRKAVLIDLNGDYLVQAMARNAQAPLGLGDDHAA